MGTPNSRKNIKLLTATFIATPLGRLFAVADEEAVYLLEFDNRRGLEREIERLRKKWNARLIHGTNSVLEHLAEELVAYFKGDLEEFTIPIVMAGTTFKSLFGNF